jgi:hypothetical protein
LAERLLAEQKVVDSSSTLRSKESKMCISVSESLLRKEKDREQLSFIPISAGLLLWLDASEEDPEDKELDIN